MAVYQGDSNFSGSTSAALSITVGTGDELFVNQMYLVVLQRTADQAGLDDWTTELQDGFSRQKVIRMIMDSPEAQTLAQRNRGVHREQHPKPLPHSPIERPGQGAADQRLLRGHPRPSGRSHGPSVFHQCRERRVPR